MPRLVKTKSNHWFFLDVNNLTILNLLCFGCFAAAQNVDGCFLFMCCYIYNNYKLVNGYMVKTCDWIVMDMFYFKKCFIVFIAYRNIYLDVSWQIVQPSVQRDTRRKHTLRANSYSILNKGRQLLINLCFYKHLKTKVAELPFL